MVYCCVPFCKSSGRTSNGISFHEFPVTDVRLLWLKKISRQSEGPGKEPWIPSDRSKVCSLHFKAEDYKQGLKSKRLKPDAVPSIFPSYPTYLQEQPKKGRRELKRPSPSSPAGGLDVDAKRKMVGTPNFQSEVQSREVESEHNAGSGLFEPSSAQEQGNPEFMSLEKSCDSNVAPGQVQDGPESAQTCSAAIPLALSINDKSTECASQEMPPILLLAPATSCKTSLVLKKLTRTRGMQTRLHSTKIVKLEKKLKTLTRKCQRLVKKRESLQEEASSLRKRMKKMDACMKKSNFTILQEKIDNNDPKALFLQEQLVLLSAKKKHWREETIRNCVLWHGKSPSGYRLLRETGVLVLPSRSTLKRYIGACTGQVVSSLIKKRLHVEAKLHNEQARCGSLVMDEMSIKQAMTYQKHSDTVHGLVDLGGAEEDYGLEDQLATHLLCFVFVGLSTHYRLPVGYYFTKALNGEQLHLLALKVMECVEDAGFKVTRLVGDNHSANCKFFAMLSGGSIKPVITHPLDSSRSLFISFDYCHILKNIRNQFLDVKRIFRKSGILILPDYLRNLYDLQEKQGAFKLVRCLTKKHLWPSNFEKMGVGRAVAIFSPQVTSVLRFLQQHGDHLGARGFEDCLPTVEFMEMVYKWFVLHNIQSTTLHWTSRDAMRMPFYGEDDERLVWLEKECLRYFESWKESSSYKLEFLSNETYEALRVTTMSTILCTRHLLSTGFKFVLTARFSSDDVESLFSSIRQLNGSNDQTDAYAALSALQKVLVTGIIHSSPSSNVGSVVGQLGLATVPPLAPTKATSETDIKKLLRPHLTMLERYPHPPQQSLRSSTLALIAGFLVRAVRDNIMCEGCIMKLESPKSHSTTTAIIAGIDRGGLSYPSIAFVGFVSLLEFAASRAAALLIRRPQPLQKFTCAVLPSVIKNPLFKCERNDSVAHTTALVKLILVKFLRPFLANFSSNMTETHAKRKLLHSKPQSRKVLKV
ncbi:DNA transposase THAP9 [Rhipicephalus sanguineus]|uniref:DNA transposase THAP9 n=1 Tax=Rhipicephalus sanguineus TaxID=34632 RepID=UPI0020C28AA3|nr:DNA transposase THAP9 [Rhipicephalus sanguineus]